VRVPAGSAWTGVAMRVATEELSPGERRVDRLAIAPV
jgi:hypothetical protein